MNHISCPGRPRLYRRRARGQRDERLRVRRLRGAVRSIVRRHGLGPISNIQMLNRSREQRQRRFRLVKRHLVPCLVDAREAEIARLARFTQFLAVDSHGRVPCGAEGIRVGVVDLQRDGLAAEPVANVVGVTVVEGYRDAGVEDVREVRKKAVVDEVACLLERPVGVFIGVCVVEVDLRRLVLIEDGG